MASLMNLAVSLTAKTGRFTKGFKTAERTVGGFAGKMRSFAAGMLRLGPMIAGIAGAAGIGMMVRSSLNSIDATAKLSDRLGIATEKLIGLRHAAEITGAGQETLDKGLGFMAKSLGEATQGVGEGKQALEALGISIQDIIALSPDEQFKKIAGRVAGLATQSEKAYVATKLFGRGGMSLVNTLALGSRGLDEMQRDAERLGLTFNRFDASKVEAAKDAISRMKSAFRGMFDKATVAIAPLIERIAEKVTELTSEGGVFRETFINAFKAVAKGGIKLVETIGGITSHINSFIGSQKVLLGTIGGAFSGGRFGQDLLNEGVKQVTAADRAKRNIKTQMADIDKFFDNNEKQDVRDEGLNRKMDTLIDVTKKQKNNAVWG